MFPWLRLLALFTVVATLLLARANVGTASGPMDRGDLTEGNGGGTNLGAADDEMTLPPATASASPDRPTILLAPDGRQAPVPDRFNSDIFRPPISARA